MESLVSRRTILTRGALGILAASSATKSRAQHPHHTESSASQGYTLPPLPYAYDALEPHIDARTMQIHHAKHHQAYVSNLNKALESHEEHHHESIDELLKHLSAFPESIRALVRNNGGGHYNHSLFWTVMTPKGGGEPKGALAKAITTDLGGFASFKESFSKAATTRFGSGWAWLARGGDGKLFVTSTANQDNPLMDGSGVPLLGLDVWEHAYYLKYQNRRTDYISAWWNTLNWDAIEHRFHEHHH